MALITRQPTSNTTPDPGQGGILVTGATNTGHAATTASVVGSGTQTKTCIWGGFAAGPAGQIASVTLKATWQESGTLVNAGSSLFRIQYSTNGGGAWTNIISHANVTASAGPTTASVSLSNSQDLTQVQVRDFLQASGSDPGDSASVTGTVSSIQIEVQTADKQVLVIM